MFRIISSKKFKEIRKNFLEIGYLSMEVKKLKEENLYLKKRLKNKSSEKRIAIKGENKIFFVKEEFHTHFLVSVFIEGCGWSEKLVKKSKDITLLGKVKENKEEM